MRTHDYEQLTVWQKSMDLVDVVYTLTKKFPADEMYGLSSQMRRAAVSIPSNIAEGSRRGTDKNFIHFLIVARASSSELNTQLKIARRLDYISDKELEGVIELEHEVFKMLQGLIASLES